MDDTPEARAFAEWLADRPWPRTPLDVDRLRELSVRAARDYQAMVTARAKVEAAHRRAARRRARRDDAGWSAF